MTPSQVATPPEVEVPLGAGARRAELRMPGLAESHVFVADPSLGRGPAAQELADRLQVLDAVETLGGEAMTMDHAREIAADPRAGAEVLRARGRWLAAWRDAGVVHALCPHCLQENRWTLPALAALQGAQRLSLADAHGRLPPFALSWPARPAARPAGAALAKTIRFELPSRAGSAPSAVDGQGIIEAIDAGAEMAAWQRFAPIGRDPPEEHDDWTFESAGFRAVLRASVALAALDGKSRPDITPADLEAMPLGDFCFLDELYALVFQTPATGAVPAACGACGQRFLPLA